MLFGVQEPVFTPRPGGTAEDDGWLLVLVNNAESWGTDLCIVDAQHISDGTVMTTFISHAFVGAYISPQASPQSSWSLPSRLAALPQCRCSTRTVQRINAHLFAPACHHRLRIVPRHDSVYAAHSCRPGVHAALAAPHPARASRQLLRPH